MPNIIRLCGQFRRPMQRLIRNKCILLFIIGTSIYCLINDTIKQRANLNINSPIATASRASLKDWHDYAAMEEDKTRVGLGEHGHPEHIHPSEKQLEEELYKDNGFNGLLSDRISINRSVPDVRPDDCKTRLYLAKLPSVSVVICFYNEHFSTLMRTIRSIINRTPHELLKQLILVNDGSNPNYFNKQKQDYMLANLAHLVTVVHNAARMGLMKARLEGAKRATGDVLVFFDSHIEVNYNWLPPLLQPIATDNKIATCPTVDIIDFNSFGYFSTSRQRARGGFDWHLFYKELPPLPEDGMDESLPYRNPIMMGGLFAINRNFFWELGGYDAGLNIWGGEQYELSFKIWMCGGKLLNVPCSHVAHIFRGPMKKPPQSFDYRNMIRNHKRVAEVWMDEYKEYIYQREPGLYNTIDEGDLSKPRTVREGLHCKSFDWFMKEVAPDFLKKFPVLEPPSYASGTIQNVGLQFCIDSLHRGSNTAVGLYPCAKNRTHPQSNQHWELSNERELRLYNRGICLDAQDAKSNNTVWMAVCHNHGDTQLWYYNRQKKWIVHGLHGHKCMEAYLNKGVYHIFTNHCDEHNVNMRWNFGSVNDNLLNKFFEGL